MKKGCLWWTNKRSYNWDSDLAFIACLWGVVFWFTLFVSTILGIGWQNGCKFFLSLIFCIFLPGVAVLKMLSGRMEITMSCAVSIAIGIALVIIQFFITSFFHVQSKACLIALCVSGISCLFLGVKADVIRKERQASIRSLHWLLFPFLVYFMFLMIITGPFNNALPTKNQSGCYYGDILWWIGNTLSAQRGWPLENFRLSGMPFYYHSFSSLFLAQLNLITGIDVIYLSLYYNGILSVTLYILSLYALFSCYFKNKTVLCYAMFLATLTDGIWQYWYLQKVLFISIGNEYAISFGILTIILSLNRDEDKTDIKHLYLAAILLMFTTGFKGPVGVSTLASMLGIACVEYISKNAKVAIRYVIISCACFTIVYLFVISGIQEKRIIDDAYTTLLPMDETYFGGIKDYVLNGWVCKDYYDYYLEHLTGIGNHLLGKMLCAFLAIFISLLKINVPVMIGASGAIMYGIIDKNERPQYFWPSVISVFVGLSFLVTMHHSGNSQRYFMYPMIAYAVLLAVGWVSSICCKKKFMVLIFLILSIVGLYNNIMNFKSDLESGLASIKDEKEWSVLDTRYVLTYDKYNAYLWMRDNLPQEAILAIDKYSSGESNHLMTGVFSEKRVWNDEIYTVLLYPQEQKRRQDIIDELTYGDMEQIKILEEEGVTHFIQNKDIDPDFYLPEDYGSIIYDQNSIVVYELHR